MSAATSPGTGLAYGLRRVCAAWGSGPLLVLRHDLLSLLLIPSRHRNSGVLGAPATGLAGCTEGRPVDDEAR